VADGLILCVSTIGHSSFFVKRLWFPSPIKFISSENVSENDSIQSVRLKTVELERIEAKALLKANLESVRIPGCVTVFMRSVLF
jgi:hypothetical protein